jgi:hypothetical protein
MYADQLDIGKIILGQEAICPDGLGRVAAVIRDECGYSIKVDTYIANRGCTWSLHNVDLIDPRGSKNVSDKG